MIKQVLKKIHWKITEHVQEYGAQYTTFGVFGLFNYPGYYLIWIYLSPQTYESFSLRLIATLLCLGLSLNTFWPEKIKYLLPVYWYFTLGFCLPYFFTYMLIMNHGANMWVANTILIIFFLMFLVDWLSCLLLLIIGSVIGFISAYIVSSNIWFYKGFDYHGFFITYFISVVIGAIFSHNKQILDKQKLQVIESIGASVAHELRTPLRSISSAASGIKKYLPPLIDTYQKAKQSELDIPYIAPSHYRTLLPAFNNIELEVHSAFTFINMLLMNVRQTEAIPVERDTALIGDCVQETLERYPFDTDEKSLIHFERVNDFHFRGNKLLVTHVLFNLMKNALHYIKAAGKGEIWIKLEKDGRYNKLYFKDTGTGISAKNLNHIFDRFFTKTPHGTGIGLAFCKMVMLSIGGDIICKSIENEYTEFVLSFPNKAIN